jgi:cell wall-associated NlpC family hydrolase
MYQHTTSISRSQLRTGDLVFYSYGSGVSHVAMYVGDGEIVHARNSRMGITKNALGAMHKDPVGYGRVPGVNQTSASRSVPNASTSNPGSSTTTRAQAAKIVADELNLSDRRNPFGVRTEAGAVGAVHHARIAYPYADGRFRPNVPITDRQIDLWLGRANLSGSQETRIRNDIRG